MGPNRIAVLGLVCVTLFLYSCEKEEGPAEKMGKEIDEAVKEFKEEYKETKEDLRRRQENPDVNGRAGRSF